MAMAPKVQNQQEQKQQQQKKLKRTKEKKIIAKAKQQKHYNYIHMYKRMYVPKAVKIVKKNKKSLATSQTDCVIGVRQQQ